MIKNYDRWLNESRAGAFVDPLGITYKNPHEDGKLCIHCGHDDSYMTKERGKFLWRCDKCGKEPLVADKPKPTFTNFKPGYNKSDYEHGLPPMDGKKPSTMEEWINWFETRCSQLRSSRKSIHMEDIVQKAKTLITGEEKLLPYTEMCTSTAGFQWGKEFLDILSHDGLFRVVKKGNKVFAELAVPDDIKQQMYKKYVGKVMGKKYGI